MKVSAALERLPLDRKDRWMFVATLAMVAIVLVMLGFASSPSGSDNPMPSTYSITQHGAQAAFTLLQDSGYVVQRWEEPLAELADHAGPDTVLITAEPFSFDPSDRDAIAEILKKGGRVIATGFQGGALLPGTELTVAKNVSFAACEAQPDGLGPLAGPGPIWIVPLAAWKESQAEIQTAYTCAGQPVVVSYPVGSGTAVWWASSTPLENASISRGEDLELLLRSVGSAKGHRVFWDESLHAVRHTQWDFVHGPVWKLFLFGSIGVGLLAVLSLSRRSGPLRSLPQEPRTTPVEFIEALGALYRSIGVSNAALQVAWERFRSHAVKLCGQQNTQLSAGELIEMLEHRFGTAIQAMKEDLLEVETACEDDQLKPAEALKLIQLLRGHEMTLKSPMARVPHGTSLPHRI
jgi:hypothetical protein